MTDQSSLSEDEAIWDELLRSEASQAFLKQQAEQAEKLLDQRPYPDSKPS